MFVILDLPSGVLGTGVKTVVLFLRKENLPRRFGSTNLILEEAWVKQIIKWRWSKEFIKLAKLQKYSDNSWSIDFEKINKDILDLSVKNPNNKELIDERTPKDIINEIKKLDKDVSDLLIKIEKIYNETVKISDVWIPKWVMKGKRTLTNAYVIKYKFRPNGNLSYENIAFLEVEVKNFLSENYNMENILEKSGGGRKLQLVGFVCLKNKITKHISNFTCFIRIKQPSVLDYKYLHKFLYFIYETGKTEQMQRNSTGIRNLQLKEYKDIFITFPPIMNRNVLLNLMRYWLRLIMRYPKRRKKPDTSSFKIIYRDILYNRHLSTKNKAYLRHI